MNTIKPFKVYSFDIRSFGRMRQLFLMHAACVIISHNKFDLRLNYSGFRHRCNSKARKVHNEDG